MSSTSSSMTKVPGPTQKDPRGGHRSPSSEPPSPLANLAGSDPRRTSRDHEELGKTTTASIRPEGWKLQRFDVNPTFRCSLPPAGLGRKRPRELTYHLGPNLRTNDLGNLALSSRSSRHRLSPIMRLGGCSRFKLKKQRWRHWLHSSKPNPGPTLILELLMQN